MRLSEADFSVLRSLRDSGVLEDAIPDRLRNSPRKVVCQCGDGHRFPEWFKHLELLCDNDELIHPVTVNGGALTLTPPLANRYGRPHDLVCLDNIREGCEIKDTRTILLGVHFPCGMAINNGLSVIEVFERFVAGKERIREKIRGAHPIMLIHVDYDGWRENGERFRTYFFNRKRFEAYLQRPVARPESSHHVVLQA